MDGDHKERHNAQEIIKSPCIQPAVVGIQNWNEIRRAWTTPNARVKPKSSALSKLLSLVSPSNQLSREQILLCVEESRPFPKHVPLPQILEVLGSQWEEDDE